MSTMRISQLAERSGVPATTLRFYETAGLLPADRTASGYRVYGEGAVERLAFIGAAKHLGLPLEEIAELLPVWDSGTCADVKADLRPRIAARVAEAERRGAELAAFTTSLHTALEHLAALPDRTSRCDPECGFLTSPTQAPAYRPVSPSRQAVEETERWRTAPIACSLTVDGLGERTAQWRQLVAGARREEIDDGLCLTVPVERVGEVAALAVSEQRCCPFFDFVSISTVRWCTWRPVPRPTARACSPSCSPQRPDLGGPCLSSPSERKFHLPCSSPAPLPCSPSPPCHRRPGLPRRDGRDHVRSARRLTV